MTLQANIKIFTLLFLSGLVLGCGSGGSDSSSTTPTPTPPNGNSGQTDASALSAPGASRDWLTKAALESSSYPHSSPIHNGYFMPVGQEDSALHQFTGSINLSSRRLTGDFAEFVITGDESFKNFPDVDLSFVSHNGYLLPLNRDRQVSLTDNSFWGIILDPGKVWSEASDEGWSRASFPFTFITARRNQTHNGLATFLYNDTEVSNLRIQIVQEGALWFQHDIYAQLQASYQPQQFANGEQVIQAFQRELDNSKTIRDWSELDSIADPSNRSAYNSGLPDNTVNQTGIIKDGEVYLQGCYTRYGEYPYCRWMRNGAYSITKSLGAAFTMFRLAELYGSHVFDLLIADYVNVTSNHSGWDTATFGDVLNMAAGIGDNGGTQDSGDIFADENGPKMETWIGVDDELGKLNISFSYGNYVWGPGEEFRYNSALTFILAAALDNYYQSVAGEGADVWQMMQEDVFSAIGIQHLPMLRTIEANGEFGIAELFHGLYPNVDDMVKLSIFMHNHGEHAGVQLLHRQSLEQALFKTDRQGLHSWWEDNQYGQSRYLHGFWSSPFGNTSACPKQIPYMSGYGGNIFAVLDNGVSLFRFSDSNSYSPANMIRISDRERAICDD